MHPNRIDPVWKPGQILETPIGEISLLRQIGAGKSGYSHLALLEDQQVVAKRMHDEPVPFYAFSDDKVALEYRAYVRLKRIGVPVPTMLHINPEKEYLIKEYVPGQDGLHAIRDGHIDDEVIGELKLLSNLCRENGINLDWFPANFVILPSRVDGVEKDVIPRHDRGIQKPTKSLDPSAATKLRDAAKDSSCHCEDGEAGRSNLVVHEKPDLRASRATPAEFGMVGAGPRITKRLAYIDYELNDYSDEWSFEKWGIWYWVNREGVTRFLETGDPSAINDPPESGKPIQTNAELVKRLLSL